MTVLRAANVRWISRPALLENATMWWKLTGLAVVTIALIVGVIPIRSRAVKFDLPPDAHLLPKPPRLSLADTNLTPGTIVLVAVILAIAAIIAFRTVRAS
jgi:hypothetical protein